MHTAAPEWLHSVLGTPALHEGANVEIAGQPFVVRGGIPRSRNIAEGSQAHTRDTFGFKWKKRDTFESPASLARMGAWLVERYGDVAHAPWLAEHGEAPLLLDAGC